MLSTVYVPRELSVRMLADANLTIDQRLGLGIGPGKLVVPPALKDALEARPLVDLFSGTEGRKYALLHVPGPHGDLSFCVKTVNAVKGKRKRGESGACEVQATYHLENFYSHTSDDECEAYDGSRCQQHNLYPC